VLVEMGSYGGNISEQVGGEGGRGGVGVAGRDGAEGRGRGGAQVCARVVGEGGDLRAEGAAPGARASARGVRLRWWRVLHRQFDGHCGAFMSSGRKRNGPIECSGHGHGSRRLAGCLDGVVVDLRLGKERKKKGVSATHMHLWFRGNNKGAEYLIANSAF